MSVSATLAANEAVIRRRQAGESVLPMGFGEAGLPVHISMTAKLAEHAGRNGYGPVAGAAELREAAAGYWNRRGLATDPDDVVAGPGSKPLLFALMSAIGGDVALPQPSWVSYAAQAELAGGKALHVPTPPGQGGVPDPDRLEAYLDQARSLGRDVRAVVMTLPDNPTGTLASAETVRRAAQVAVDYDLTIICDQIYRDLTFDSVREYADPATYAPERTVITTGLSKNLALGGWRVGVARLPGSHQGRLLRDRLLNVASEVWSSAPQPMQHAAAYAFGEPIELTERIEASRRLHAAVARAAAERFRAADAVVAEPQGGFYIYPDLAAHRDLFDVKYSVRTGAELSELLMTRYGVGVLPGSVFGDGVKELRLRVAVSQLYGETDEQRCAALASHDPTQLPWIAESLDRLEEVLTDLTS
ncbi:MAG: pyridoxal phosphate-dependent aminotransferase [Stackebrandtia sp.]